MAFEDDKDPAGPPITNFSDRDFNNAERGIKLFAIADGAAMKEEVGPGEPIFNP